MILQALHKLAEREGLLANPDYEPKEVAWIVRIDEVGKFLGFIGTHFETILPGRKKPKVVAKKIMVPIQPLGRSGTKAPACFMVDNAKYVFGLPTKDKEFSETEGLEKSGSFLDLVRLCASETEDKATLAIISFLESVRSGKENIKLPEDCKSNDLFAFAVAPDFDCLVHERSAIQTYWKKLRSMFGGGTIETPSRTCLVSGNEVADSGLFKLIKKVPGGSSSGVALVSFNKAAFESYGWKGNDNAPISREASEACAATLNRLLDDQYPDPKNPDQTMPVRNLRLSTDTVVCFWSEKSGDEFCSVFGGLLEANPEMVKAIYQSVWRGRVPDIEDLSAFYALTLTGTQGRAIVRGWFESTVKDVAQNIARHFADLDIVRNTPKPKERDLPPQMPLSLLVKALAPEGDSKKIPAPFIAEIITAALKGTQYPLSILQRSLERTRAEIGNDSWIDLERRDARAAMIKGCTQPSQTVFPGYD